MLKWYGNSTGKAFDPGPGIEQFYIIVNTDLTQTWVVRKGEGPRRAGWTAPLPHWTEVPPQFDVPGLDPVVVVFFGEVEA